MRFSCFVVSLLLSLSPLLHAELQIPGQRREYRFPLGVTGVSATIDKQQRVTVESIDPDSPADGRLEPGDVIVAIGGEKVHGPDPRVGIGLAIGRAEAGNGCLEFSTERDDAPQAVSVTIPTLGAYSDTYPLDCPKSEKIVEQAAAFYTARIQRGELKGLGIEASLASLFLLSTGREQDLAVVEGLLHGELTDALKIGDHTWNNGYAGILLAEYYLRTGDQIAWKPLQMICDDAVARETHGGWGHWGYPGPGYVQSGLVNAAGAPLFTALVLARECGVEIDPQKFVKILRFFYRFPGYGSVPYGDHRPSCAAGDNGKNGMVGCALSLIDEPPFQAAARMYALSEACSHDYLEQGHTGNFFNILWRGLAAVHVPADRQRHYRDYLDGTKWYFDLCRRPGGGFHLLQTAGGETRYTSPQWGVAVALAYTAPRRTLRITGAPPARYSRQSLPPLESRVGAKGPFLRLTPCEEMKDGDFGSWTEIHERLRYSARKQYKGDEPLPSIEYCAKHMRHWDLSVRKWAANTIGYHGDAAVPEVIKALNSLDPRVRRAGLDAISGYQEYFGSMCDFPYTADGLSRVMPRVVEILEDPQSHFWEIDGALWALTKADRKTIQEHLPILLATLKSDDWWLRAAAWYPITALGPEAAPAVGDLVDCFAAETHSKPKWEYRQKLQQLFLEDKVKVSDEVRWHAMSVVGEYMVDPSPREPGYVKSNTRWFEHRGMHVLACFEPDELANIADYVNQVLASFGDPHSGNYDSMHATWTLYGDGWGNPGLIHMIEQMSPDRRSALIPGLKSLLAGGLDEMFKQQKKEDLMEKIEQVKAAARRMIEASRP